MLDSLDAMQVHIEWHNGAAEIVARTMQKQLFVVLKNLQLAKFSLQKTMEGTGSAPLENP